MYSIQAPYAMNEHCFKVAEKPIGSDCNLNRSFSSVRKLQDEYSAGNWQASGLVSAINEAFVMHAIIIALGALIAG